MDITTISNSIIMNRELPNPAFKLYCVMAMLAGMNDLTSNCAVLDNSIIQDTSLSYGAFRLYCVMAKSAGFNAIPIPAYIPMLSTFMGCSDSTTRRRVKELTNKGIVEKKVCEVYKDVYDTCFVLHDCIRNKKEG